MPRVHVLVCVVMCAWEVTCEARRGQRRVCVTPEVFQLSFINVMWISTGQKVKRRGSKHSSWQQISRQDGPAGDLWTSWLPSEWNTKSASAAVILINPPPKKLKCLTGMKAKCLRSFASRHKLTSRSFFLRLVKLAAWKLSVSKQNPWWMSE